MIEYFLAATRSVGRAATLALAGFYLHRRGHVTSEGKKLLALLSQQITIPLLLFTKVVYCDVTQQSGYTTSEHMTCPSVLENIQHTWVLLLWPIYVVACGLVVGYIAANISNTPKYHRCAIMASCAFANSTGLPITLLVVIRANFPPNTEIGQVDPALFLSLYLLLYPILQWGIGSWLLSPPPSNQLDLSEGADEDTQVHDLSLVNEEVNPKASLVTSSVFSSPSIVYKSESSQQFFTLDYEPRHRTSFVIENATVRLRSSLVSFFHCSSNNRRSSNISLWKRTIREISQNAFQPPVIGALLGIFISSIRPLRGLFVQLSDSTSSVASSVDNSTDVTTASPTSLPSVPFFGWFFDGLYDIGEAAIPINMIILGVNLASFYFSSKATTMVTSFYHADRNKDMVLPQEVEEENKTPACCDTENSRDLMTTLSYRTIAAAVLGKMVVMPLIGILSIYFLHRFVLNIPDGTKLFQ